MREENQLSETSHNSPERETHNSRKFLESDYSVANQWAMHGENLSHRIFSFYVTLVTATLGSAIAISQGLSESMKSSFLIIGTACVLLILIGPVFYEALVRDHIRNVGYRNRMSEIRYKLMAYRLHELDVSELEQNNPGGNEVVDLLDPYHPSAIHHALVGLINSILVALSIPALLWGIAGPGYKIQLTILASIFSFVITFLLHRGTASYIVRRHYKSTH